MRESNINSFNFPLSWQTSKAVYGFRVTSKDRAQVFHQKNTVTWASFAVTGLVALTSAELAFHSWAGKGAMRAHTHEHTRITLVSTLEQSNIFLGYLPFTKLTHRFFYWFLLLKCIFSVREHLNGSIKQWTERKAYSTL